MSDTNNALAPNGSAVFDIMKSINEQQSLMALSNEQDSADPSDLKNRFLAAAMSMLGAAGSQLPWEPDPYQPKHLPTAPKPEVADNWVDQNIASRLFSGFLNPPTDANSSQQLSNEFPFPNPFLLFPHCLPSLDGQKHPGFLTNGNKDEDFCELCQKHFCNKYYLRKHKNDVHRISSEAFSQVRKRDGSLGMAEEDSSQSDKNVVDWMNNLSSTASTNQQQQLEQQSFSRKMSIDFSSSEACLKRQEDSLPAPITTMSKPEISRLPMVEFGCQKTFIPPVSIGEPTQIPLITPSTSPTQKTLHTGALDVFKSSMAAAKLADRVTCDLCKKELCNKYFLRTHKIKVHGLSPREVGGPTPRSAAKQHQFSEKIVPEPPKINLDPFCIPPTLPPPSLGLMPPMSPSQLPAPLGSLPSWLPPPPSIESMTSGHAAIQHAQQLQPPSQQLGEGEDTCKDPVMQLMAANALVTCPLCNKMIGPRLFLPTHLTSVHALSPTDPSFFIFILSARAADGEPSKLLTATSNNTANANTITTTTTTAAAAAAAAASHSSGTGSPTGFRTSTIGDNRNPTAPPFRSNTNPTNGLLPPPPPPMTTGPASGGSGGFDLAGALATTQTSGLLLPPPLGLYQSPQSHGILPQQPAAPPGVGAVNANATNKWNNPLEAVKNGPITSATTPRKSPNQMRVLCNICNKWICNKYFLRTHKANKHGITDPPLMVGSPTAPKSVVAAPSGPLAPLDFSKPTCNDREKNAEIIPPTPMSSSGMFQNPAPTSTCLPQTFPAQSYENASDRGFPLNLSLKPATQPRPQAAAEIKHGVDQFLSNPPQNSHLRRQSKSSCRSYRRRLRIQKIAARLLAKSWKRIFSRRKLPKRQLPLTGTSTRSNALDLVVRGLGEQNTSACSPSPSSKPWQNFCHTCNAWFNKRSQLEAHLYATGHLRQSRPKEEAFQTSPGVYSLPTESTAVSVNSSSDCSLEETTNWWAHQQNRPLNFPPTVKQTPVPPSSGVASATVNADQFQCSYQASHLIHHSVFGEPASTTTTTPSL